MAFRRCAVLLFFLSPLMGGCGAAPTGPSVASHPQAPAVPAPEFTLNDLHGQAVRLDDFRGKVVFLDFWATWCPPCRASLPAVEKLSEEYAGKNFQVIGMNLDEDPEAVAAYVAKHKTPYPVLQVGNSDVADRYGVSGIPHFVLIDAQGRRVDQWSGFGRGEPAAWRRAIDALLAAPASPS